MASNEPSELYSEDLLRETLWPAQGPLSRSVELSPFYVWRYAGPRIMQEYTVHDNCEILCVMGGKGEFFQESGRITKLEKGVVLVIPKGLKHFEFSEGQLDTIWIGVTGSRIAYLPQNVLSETKSSALPEHCEQLYFEARRQNANCGAILDSLTSLILAKVLAHQSSECSGGIQQAMRYLHDNFEQEISFSQLAHDLGYSEGYFYRLFKKNCNMTPGEFLANVRIEHAIEMVRRTSLSFTQIAEECGIGDGLYLSRLIKGHTGHSPRELRRQFRAHSRSLVGCSGDKDSEV